MKKDFSLSIANPCSENWNAFTPSEKGRFCDSCRKVVVDFTSASDSDIFNFLQTKSSGVCGRFKLNQIKTYSYAEPVKINTGFTLLKAGIISLLLMIISKPGFTQKIPTSVLSETYQTQTPTAVPVQKTDYIVRGIVRSEEDNAPLPGVSVVLKGTTVGTQTDIEGKFEFPQKLKKGDVLAFYFIGLKTKEITIPNHDLLVVELSMEMDMDIMGEVAITELYTPKQSFLKKAWHKLTDLF